MAVSHQWFVQWSSPSLLFADISRKYDNINPNWNYKQNYRSPYEHPSTSKIGFYKSNYEQTRSENDEFDLERSKINDISRQYNNINPKWNYKQNYGTPYERSPTNYKGYYESNYEQNLNVNDEYDLEKPKLNDQAHVAGLTLWLAMLGLAQTVSVPTDTETLPFNTLYKWKYVDFEFPTERQRQYAIANGEFVPANVLPLGLEVWGSRVWVTLPSWRRGVPATLATVSRKGGVRSPRLQPYPDWSYHRAFSNNNNCSGLTSVFRMSVDPCGRLWVLDSGQIDSQDEPKQICPPSIIVFDLKTDLPIARYVIPKEYVLEDSLYSNIIVDSRREDCSDLYVYIADTWRFGLLVFRESDESFWRFSHHLFFPDPLASNYTLHGLNFQWTDGIFGLALSPVDNYGERILFFHSMSSYRELYVKASILRDSSRVNNSATDFHLLGESRGLYGQSSGSAIDNRGVMFYGLVTRDSIGCWNIKKPYQKKNTGVVAMNTETLIFPNDIKVDQEKRQNVWVLSNRLPMFQAGSLGDDDYNYRIMYADTSEAVRGTVCDPSVTL